MENLNESGKIYFFKTNLSETPSEAFGPLLEVNSNFDILRSLNICGGKALGITSNNELLEWEFDSKQKTTGAVKSPNNNLTKSKNLKKNDFYFLLFKPSYHFHKIKFLQISLNKTMCIGLDTYHNVLVWGQSKEGLLGLGYEVTSVESPTIISKLKEIKEVSLSDYHAVALNSNGNAFSWGLGKYGELGLERSIYTPTPQQILTETVYSKVFCGNLITCFIDENGKFYYFGVIIKQLGGYGNIVTLKSLLNDQSYHDGKNIYFEKEIEELENESFNNIVIGNGFVALLSKNGLLYVVEYNNKLTMLYSKFFLYNITVAYNEIYGLARERPKIDKNKKDNYYLFKWSSKTSSENELYSDIWSTTIWKFQEDFKLISNSKLLESNNNKNILLLKDQDEKYNLTNSIFNPHRKNLEISTQNNDIQSLEKSVNNPNISAFGDLVINKKILPEKFLEYNNQYDDSYNIKYKKCKIKLNIRTGIDNSSLYLNNNKSRTFNQMLKYSQNNNLNGNSNKNNNSSMSPFIEQNFSHNNNLFSESYNAQLDLGKENDNVNIYKPEEEDDIIQAKEKELNKYRKEVDNIINNFKSKKDSSNITTNSLNTNKNNKLLYTSRDNNRKNKTNENSLKYISQNNSNQNERYSSSGNNFYGINQDEEDNNIDRIKLKLSKEEMINLIQLDNKKKEKTSNYNDSLSRVRNNIISVKNKIKFKDNALNKISNLFTLSEEDEFTEENDNQNSDEENNNYQKNRNKSVKNINKIKNNKRKHLLKKFMRSPSFSNLKSKNRNNKRKKDIFNNEEGDKSDSEDFVNIEDLGSSYKRKRYNSKDNIFLKETQEGKDENEKENLNNLGMKYISGNNSENGNLKIDNKKNKIVNIKNGKNINNDKANEENISNKLRGIKKSKKNNNYEGNEEEEGEEEEEEDVIKEKKDLKGEKIILKNKKKIIKNRNKHKSKEKNVHNNDNINKENNFEIEELDSEKDNKKTKQRKLNKNRNKNNEEIEQEESGDLEEDEEEEIDFFDEINEDNKKIRKIKKIKENKKIRIKKSNSISTEDYAKMNKPQEYKLFEDSFKEINIKLKNKKYSKSLDKIDKRKSISNILISPNRIYIKKKKNHKKKNINEDKNEDDENYEEEYESYEKNKNQKNNNKNTVKKNDKNQNKFSEEENNLSNDDRKNKYNENDEITFKKNNKSDKNKIIDNKKQFNAGKRNNLNNKRSEDENSKNSYTDEIYDYNIKEKGNEQNNKIKNNHRQKEKIGIKIKNSKEKEEFKNSKNYYDNKYLNMKAFGITINKFSLMYFCELVEHYMKKKSFALCARQIANYQKYLEIKFSLKILFRVMLKRIIFYKLKFMHRYKRINKYLIKNKIKNIQYAYKNKK